MKSICIKLTNKESIDYLLEKFNNINLEKMYFSYKKFKNYQNIIVHYKGENLTLFIKQVSKILSSLIIDIYEENIIKILLKSEFFYFDDFEQQQILNITIEDLYSEEETVCKKDKRIDILSTLFFNYLCSNHSIILKGFATFRIKKYLKILLEQIDKSVNKYIIEKEYIEFISLLKIYINSASPLTDFVYLIYNDNKPILLDKNKQIIKIDTNSLDAKYLSDISFSSNDYTLNTLLSILPNKIYVYLIDSKTDDFINTLKLIFEHRIIFCTNTAKNLGALPLV